MTAIRMETVAEPYIRRRGHPPPGEGPHRHPGRRHRQPVRHHRHRRRPPRPRAGGRHPAQGDASVDGVYSDDPEINPHAVRYEKLTYAQVLRDNLQVMDMAAISLCREGKMPILVFNFKREGNIERAIAGHPIGTLVERNASDRSQRPCHELPRGLTMTSDEILMDTEERMEKAVNVFRDELRGLRTGRATPALVDSLRVEYYGSPTPLKQLAQISTPDPQQIVIRPFDPACSRTSRRRSAPATWACRRTTTAR